MNLLSIAEVSRRTGFSPSTLRKWKCQQRAGQDTGHEPLRFMKLGEAKQARLRVAEADLEDWLTNAC